MYNNNKLKNEASVKELDRYLQCTVEEGQSDHENLSFRILENDEFIADSGAEIVKVQDNDNDEYEEDDEEENLVKAFIPFGNYW